VPFLAVLTNVNISVYSFKGDNKFTNQSVGNDVSIYWCSLFLKSFMRCW